MKMYESKQPKKIRLNETEELPFDVKSAIDDLEKALSKLIKSPVKLEYRVENVSSGFGKKISFSSNNLVSKSGIFALAIKEVKVSSFGSGIEVKDDKGRSLWWVGIDLRYEGRSAGRNGMNIATGYYDFTDSANPRWLFTMAGEGGPAKEI
jgi:hypothetical protein